MPLYTEGRLSVQVKYPTEVEKRKYSTCMFEKCQLNDVSIHCIGTRQGTKRIISEDKISKHQDATVPYLSNR